MKACVVGCAGKMGSEIVKAILEYPEDFSINSGIVSYKSQHIGRDIGEVIGMPKLGFAATDKIPANCDMVIDFSTPKAALSHAEFCAEHNMSYITGVTGLSERQLLRLEELAMRIPLFYSPNMSFAINLMAALVEKVSAYLGSEYDIEILEMHHNQKLDAPSGTALLLGKAAANGRGLELKNHIALDRNKKRKPNDIGFASLRGGDVIGEHKVIFAGTGERLELAHIDTKRSVFAHGALKAAKWLSQQKPGKLYSMKDMLSL